MGAFICSRPSKSRFSSSSSNQRTSARSFSLSGEREGDVIRREKITTMESCNQVEVAQNENETEETIEWTSVTKPLSKSKRNWIIFWVIIVVLSCVLSLSLVIWNIKKDKNSNTSTKLPSSAVDADRLRTIGRADCPAGCSLNANSRWRSRATTVAGGHGRGNAVNQLDGATSIDLDEDEQCIYITDSHNDRVMKWKFNADEGEVVAGGNGRGNRSEQLNEPSDAIRRRNTDSLIVCDMANRRIVDWSLRRDRGAKSIVIDVTCWGLAEDARGDLYISDWINGKVIRWRHAQSSMEIVAGGHVVASRREQLFSPRFLYVDMTFAVYIADANNTRVVKWQNNAIDAVLLVDAKMTTRSIVTSVFVDHLGDVYFSETNTCRISRWTPTTNKSRVLVGGHRCSDGDDQLSSPMDFTFDHWGNLYVVDRANHRVQHFQLDG